MKKYSLLFTALALSLGLVACQNDGKKPKGDPGKNEEVTLEIVFGNLGLENGGVFSEYVKDDFTLSASKGAGTVNPAYYDREKSIRLYSENELSFAADGGILSIEFGYYDETITKEIYSDVGDFDFDLGLWSGNAKEVTFTAEMGSGNLKIESLLVTYMSKSGGGSDPGEEVSITTFDFSKIGEGEFESFTIGDVTISAIKGTGSVVPQVYGSGDLRTYKGNVLTIEGKKINKIQFTLDSKSGSMEPDVGSLTGTVWTSSSTNNEVNFNITDGQRRFKTITVTHGGEGGDVPPGTRTVSSIAIDLASVLEYPVSNIEYVDGEAYIALVYSGVESLEDAVIEGCYSAAELDYLVFDEYTGIIEDKWNDGSEGVFAWFYDEDYESNGLTVEIGSWLEDGEYFTQFCVYIEDE